VEVDMEVGVVRLRPSFWYMSILLDDDDDDDDSDDNDDCAK